MRLAHAACLITATLLAACGGSTLPAAEDLYGTWQGTADCVTRDLTFVEVDESGGGLDGLRDVHELGTVEGDAIYLVQSGTFRVERATISGSGDVDALVFEAVTGEGAPGTYANEILGWTGDTLTISSATAMSGRLVLERH